MHRMGGYCVQGAVKYVSPEPDLYAELKIDYYDVDEELIDNEVDTVNFRETGKTTAFHIMYSGPRRWEIQYYKLYITAKKRA